MDSQPADVTGNARIAEAKRIARTAVTETQGSALRAETAEINRSVTGQLATFAGKWMINNANWLARLYKGREAAGYKGTPATFLTAVAGSVIAASAVMVALRAALQPEDDDDKQREGKDYAFKMGMDAISQPHWAGRLISTFAYAAMSDQPTKTGGFISTGNTPIDGVSMVVKQLSADHTDWAKALSGAVAAGSLVLPIPATEARRVIDAASTDWESGWEQFVASIMGRDRVMMLRD
jgi:hypothetical protein